MTKNQIPELLDELRSQETFIRNDAIKKIIKEKMNDEHIISALIDVIKIDPSISVRNFARSALDVFGVEHSAMEDEVVLNYNTMASPINNDSQNTEASFRVFFIVVAITVAVFVMRFLCWPIAANTMY